MLCDCIKMEPYLTGGLAVAVAVAVDAVLLYAGRAQAGGAETLNRALPGEKFFDRERVTIASVFERKQTSFHRHNDLSLAANDPALGIWRRQIGYGERVTIRSHHVAYVLPLLRFCSQCHSYLDLVSHCGNVATRSLKIGKVSADCNAYHYAITLGSL